MEYSHTRDRQSLLSYPEAILLALLPYDRRLYIEGGILAAAECRTPGAFNAPQLWRLLRSWFGRERIDALHLEAGNLADRYPLGGTLDGYVTLWDLGYPALLRSIFDPPPVLFWSGAPLPSPESRMVGVVGTRRVAAIASAATELLVERWGGESPRPVVVSGLAFGVDRVAHLAAIQKGLAGVAVLASGLDRAGPRANLDLVGVAARRAVALTLLSEFAPGVETRRYHFPRRNRIIAGLCAEVAVMQAPSRSGAMITAHYALDEGRRLRLFDHPLLGGVGFNEGCRELIEAGGELIELPELEERIVNFAASAGMLPLAAGADRLPYRFRSEPMQLELFRMQMRGDLRWLGGSSWYLGRHFDAAGGSEKKG